VRVEGEKEVVKVEETRKEKVREGEKGLERVREGEVMQWEMRVEVRVAVGKVGARRLKEVVK